MVYWLELIMNGDCMKYAGMPSGMWMIFSKSFKRQLITDLNYSENEAALIAKRAKPRYREIVEKLPEFDKEKFAQNISQSCLKTLRQSAYAACWIMILPKKGKRWKALLDYLGHWK